MIRLRIRTSDGRVHTVEDAVQVVVLNDFDDPLVIAENTSPGNFLIVRPGEPEYDATCRAANIRPPAVLNLEGKATDSPLDRWR
jgi:hypothetical protein